MSARGRREAPGASSGGCQAGRPEGRPPTPRARGRAAAAARTAGAAVRPGYGCCSGPRRPAGAVPSARPATGGTASKGHTSGRGGPQQRGESLAFGLAPAGAHSADVAQPRRARCPTRTAPGRPVSRPLPGSQPPTRTSATRMFRILIQARERTPGSYAESSRLQTRPSRPCARVASQGLLAVTDQGGRASTSAARPARSASSRGCAAGCRAGQRGSARRGASRRTGRDARAPSRPAGAALPGDCTRPMRDCSNWKSARPCSSSASTSPSSTAGVRPSAPPSGRSSG